MGDYLTSSSVKIVDERHAELDESRNIVVDYRLSAVDFTVLLYTLNFSREDFPAVNALVEIQEQKDIDLAELIKT